VDAMNDWREYAELQLSPALGSALDLFVELGYHGTSVRDIARNASLSVPGLYHHHPSKQDLLATLLSRSGHDLLERSIAAMASAGSDPRDRFIAQVENVVLYVTHRRKLARLAHEIPSLTPEFKARHVELRDTQERFLTQEITAAAERGYFATDNPREASRAVLVLCRGVADWYSPGGEFSPEQIAERYVRFALALVGDLAANTPPPADSEPPTD
jgi:AcrR family transcriptional regulator